MKAKKRVLIVEDDRFIAKVIQTALQNEGLETSIVYDGEQALKALSKSDPDLMLLDLLLPKMDGFHVLAWAKEQGKKFPIIVLTNLSDTMHRIKCKQLGCVALLTKSDMDDSALGPLVKKYLR